MTKEIFTMSMELAERKNIVLKLPPLIGEDKAEYSCHRTCAIPFEELFIGSDNNIRPCIISNEHLGSMENRTIPDMWLNDNLNNFRNRINSGIVPDDCKSCNQNRHINVNRYESHIKINAKIPMGKAGKQPYALVYTSR